ncbi:head completion/stabilization protein [Pseudomonas trivialis]|uniref:head completion/stabilization protein n=1 Tax=Pseudomonas trivialis TaxID=200450 RepID=UPI0030D29C94
MSFSGKPTTFVEQTIENDGFWPDLSVSEFQKEQRLPAEYLVELLVDTLKSAMVEVNTDLARVKATLQGAGVLSLTAAAGAGTPAAWAYAHKITLYKRAVYCRAKAHSLPQFATVNRRESAENTGKEAPERVETFLAFSQQAVRVLQGRGRITAALQ